MRETLEVLSNRAYVIICEFSLKVLKLRWIRVVAGKKLVPTDRDTLLFTSTRNVSILKFQGIFIYSCIDTEIAPSAVGLPLLTFRCGFCGYSPAY